MNHALSLVLALSVSAEGFDLTTTHLPRQFDFVWIHPPYWNAIRYSDQPNDLSAAPTYELFASSLRTCLQH